MKMIHVELPSEIDSEFQALGLTDPTGIAVWVADAIRQKLLAEKQLRYLETRAARGNREKFREVLAKVPAAEPTIEDCM